jgi:hypothetical protein
MDDIDHCFKQKNKHILQQRQHGYWIWKPYIILKKLLEIDENDILCYNDSKLNMEDYNYLENIMVTLNMVYPLLRYKPKDVNIKIAFEDFDEDMRILEE